MPDVNLKAEKTWYLPYLPVIAITLFLIPPVAIILNSQFRVENDLLVLSGLTIPLGYLVSKYWLMNEQYPILKSNIDEQSTVSRNYDMDLLKMDYEQTATEIRYRERLILRSTYVSLATLGVLFLLFVRVPEIYYPLISLLGALISAAFKNTTEAYKQTRDKLWERILEIEREITNGQTLSIYHTILYDDRNSYRKYLNSTDRVAEMHFYIFLIFNVAYIVTTLDLLRKSIAG